MSLFSSAVIGVLETIFGYCVNLFSYESLCDVIIFTVHKNISTDSTDCGD